MTAAVSCRNVAWIVVLATVITAAASQDVKKPARRRCGKGCYEVLEMDGKFKQCDCCEKAGGLTTPCAVTMCSVGAECVVENRPCELNDTTIGCSHDLKATCLAPCKNEVCGEGYTEVYQTNRCKTCEKFGANFTNPCHLTDCQSGYKCVLKQNQCPAAPCDPVAQCRPIECPKGCVKYVNGGDEFCRCCNGCVNKTCADGGKCKLEVVNCIRSPCPPTAKC